MVIVAEVEATASWSAWVGSPGWWIPPISSMQERSLNSSGDVSRSESGVTQFVFETGTVVGSTVGICGPNPARFSVLTWWNTVQ
jgi:hypothetical protein